MNADTQGVDYLGDPLPDGFEPWSCDDCSAVCNFEAMNQCARRTDPTAPCAFDRDKPESNGGCFAFIRRKTP